VNGVSWTLSSLRQKYGDKYFFCGVSYSQSMGISNNNDGQIIMTLTQYLDKHLGKSQINSSTAKDEKGLNTDTDILYIFDPTFDVGTDLLLDYDVHIIFSRYVHDLFGITNEKNASQFNPYYR